MNVDSGRRKTGATIVSAEQFENAAPGALQFLYGFDDETVIGYVSKPGPLESNEIASFLWIDAEEMRDIPQPTRFCRVFDTLYEIGIDETIYAELLKTSRELQEKYIIDLHDTNATTELCGHMIACSPLLVEISNLHLMNSNLRQIE
jgi:hypothetical protein